jgi:hypothetical protein
MTSKLCGPFAVSLALLFACESNDDGSPDAAVDAARPPVSADASADASSTSVPSTPGLDAEAQPDASLPATSDASRSDASASNDARVALIGDAGVSQPGPSGGDCSALSLWEPNDSPALACALLPEAKVSSGFLANDVADYYLLPVKAGSIYSLDLRTPSSCKLNIAINLGADGLRAPLVAATANSNIAGVFPNVLREFTPQEDGVALVHVSPSGACPTYELSVHRSTDDGLVQDGLTREFNNTPSTASVIAQATNVQSGFIDANDPDDYYRLPVKKGSIYSLDVKGKNDCKLAYEANLGADGKRAPLLPLVNNFTIAAVFPSVVREFTPPEDGLALLRFSAAGACLSYGFTVHPSTDDGLVHDPLTREYNDTPSTAAVFALGTAVAAGFPDVTDPTDYYRVVVQKGVTYTLELRTPVVCKINYEANLGPDGKRAPLVAAAANWTIAEQFTNVVREFTPPEDGVMLLHVTPAGGTCLAYEFVVRAPG